MNDSLRGPAQFKHKQLGLQEAGLNNNHLFPVQRLYGRVWFLCVLEVRR